VIRRSSVDLLDVSHPAKSASYLAVEGWINGEAARGLFVDAGLTLDAMMPLAEHANFAPVSLPLRAAIHVQSDLTSVTSTNIVARLEGAGEAAEHVLYSAQWNRLPVGDGSRDDLTDTEAGDQPPPGVPVVLEVARALAREPKIPQSFVFLAVTAESEGLAGLDYYLSNPVYPLTGMRAAIHLAGFSMKGPGHHLSIIGPSFPALKELVRQQAAEQFRVASPDPDPERSRFYGSSEDTYRERAIPSVFLASWQASDAVSTAPVGSADMSVAVLDAQLLFRLGRRVVTAGNWPSRQTTRALPAWAAPPEARNQGQSTP
jgi:Zn-dependent M28 family amino/carboxypeptidase